MASNPKGSHTNIIHAIQRLGSAMEAQRAEAQHFAWCAALLSLRDARKCGEPISLCAAASILAERFPGEPRITTKNFRQYVRRAETTHSQGGGRGSRRLTKMLEAICNA